MTLSRVISLTLTLPLMMAAAVVAQPRVGDSHERLPGRIDRSVAEKRVMDRFNIAAEKTPLGLLENLLKDPEKFGVNKEMLEKLAKEAIKDPGKFGVDLNDPKMMELAKQLAERAKNLTPEQIENLRKLIPDIKPPDNVKPPDLVKPPDNVKPPDHVKPPDMNPMNPPFVEPPKPMPDQPEVIKMPSNMTQRRAQSDNWISRQMDNLRGSSLTTGLRNQISGMFGPGSGLGNLTRGISQDLRRFSARILPRMDGIRFDGITRRMGNLIPRNLNVSASRVSLPSIGGGGLSVGSAEGVGGLALVLLGIAAVAFFFLVLAKNRGWVGKSGDGWKLGPWPVDPKAVRTREDVVKAFEYLAMLLLGKQAGAANHLDIASRIGDSNETQRREAARDLARAYEHARYAPPQELLSEQEVRQTREGLELLAGVAAA